MDFREKSIWEVVGQFLKQCKHSKEKVVRTEDEKQNIGLGQAHHHLSTTTRTGLEILVSFFYWLEKWFPNIAVNQNHLGMRTLN